MIILSQRDPRWGDITMKPSNLKLSRYGCTTMCVCMLSDYFGCFMLPQQAVDVNIKYNSDGMILWWQINFDKFKWDLRIRRYDPFEINISVRDPKKAVILTIDRDAHWVVLLRPLFAKWYYVADPWDGRKKWIRADRVSGSSHFIRK